MSNEPSSDHVQSLLRLKRYERPAEGYDTLAEQTVAAFHRQALHRARTITIWQLLKEKWQSLRPVTAVSLAALPVLMAGLIAWSYRSADRSTLSQTQASSASAVELISSSPVLTPNEKIAPAVQNVSEQKNQSPVKKTTVLPPATEANPEDSNIIIVR